MQFQEHVPLGRRTTMRIGGNARWFALLQKEEDVTQAFDFAQKHSLPFVVLGGGSNTIFTDKTVEALVVQIARQYIMIDAASQRITVGCGKPLAALLMEAAVAGLDLSALAGIPGSIGGAIFGNAGQGPDGIWIDSFVESVKVFAGGEWKTLSKQDCAFGYRESIFKHSTEPTILWEATLNIPQGDPRMIIETIDALLKKRFETQPHGRTAGSCFKAVRGSLPAWKLIDKAGLRGLTIGDVQIADKHANFLLNLGGATYLDARTMVETVRSKIAVPLEVEMRFIEPDGSLAF